MCFRSCLLNSSSVVLNSLVAAAEGHARAQGRAPPNMKRPTAGERECGVFLDTSKPPHWSTRHDGLSVAETGFAASILMSRPALCAGVAQYAALRAAVLGATVSNSTAAQPTSHVVKLGVCARRDPLDEIAVLYRANDVGVAPLSGHGGMPGSPNARMVRALTSAANAR